MERCTLATMFVNQYPIYVLLGCASLLLASGVSRAGDIPFDESLILVDHQPFNTGGPAADTAFRLIEGGNLISNTSADDFRLNQSALLGSVVWWGFYGNDFINEEELPPASQIFRMRIYEARAGDGLPGLVHAERLFDNPFFEPTGRPVLTSVLPPEIRFEATLHNPVALSADTDYWFEVTQIGLQGSTYRWIISQEIQNSYAFNNMVEPNWALSQTGADLAFQLRAIPEPTALVVLLFPVGQLVVRRRRFESRYYAAWTSPDD